MKHYVVRKWRTPWIYTSRDECKKSVDGFLGALYKWFPDYKTAKVAYENNLIWHKWQYDITHLQQLMGNDFEKSICTDAACPSNPGPIEYRGVIVSTGQEIFNYGPLYWWSVNIAEFLAIVEWLKRLVQNKQYSILYSDSKTAIWWIKKGSINTTIRENNQNKKLFEIVHNSIQWLKLNSDRSYHITLSKRPTSQRGQIPADFWRK